MSCSLCLYGTIPPPFTPDFQLRFQNNQLITINLANRRLLDPRSPSSKYPPRPPPANRNRKRLAVDVYDAETNTKLAPDSLMICIENKQRERSKKKESNVNTNGFTANLFFFRTLFGYAVVAMLVRFWRVDLCPQSTATQFTTRFDCYCLWE